MYGYIYKITNLLNNKIYIGKHKYSKYELDESYITSGIIINQSISKHGIENFNIELIDKASSLEELNQLEIFYIKEFNSKYPIGYNLTDGGDGARGIDSWNKGQTKESNELVRLNTEKSKQTKMKKYGNAFGKLNKQLSEEHKQKIKETNKNQKPSEYCKYISSIRNKGTHFYNNGSIEKKFKDNECIPHGFVKGRLKNPFPDQTGKKKSKDTIEKIKQSKSNIIWINNGKIEKMVKKDLPLPNGFKKGRIKPMNNL